MSGRNGSFLRTIVICLAGLVLGIPLARTRSGAGWATAIIIGAVVTPIATAHTVRKNGGTLNWSRRTSDRDPEAVSSVAARRIEEEQSVLSWMSLRRSHG